MSSQLFARIARFLRWLVPGAVLVFLPKCPACLAAYVALGTGLSVSLPLAETLRVSLLAVSVGALAFLVGWRTRRLARVVYSRFKKIPSNTPTPNATAMDS